MATTVVTIAAIAARAEGVHKTAPRNAPAALYKTIEFRLTFNNEATDFVAGDVIFGQVDLSTDGGTTWRTLVEAEWHGGTDPGPDPEKGSPGGYMVAVDNLTVPANSQYRAGMRVVPGTPGGTVTCGVQATVTT